MKIINNTPVGNHEDFFGARIDAYSKAECTRGRHWQNFCPVHFAEIYAALDSKHRAGSFYRSVL